MPWHAGGTAGVLRSPSKTTPCTALELTGDEKLIERRILAPALLSTERKSNER
jgi:hypothetical protein